MHLEETINDLNNSCRGEHVNLGQVTDSIEARAFGILLLLPALVIIRVPYKPYAAEWNLLWPRSLAADSNNKL